MLWFELTCRMVNLIHMGRSATLYWIELNWIELNWIIFHFIALHCIECTAVFCTMSLRTASLTSELLPPLLVTHWLWCSEMERECGRMSVGVRNWMRRWVCKWMCVLGCSRWVGGFIQGTFWGWWWNSTEQAIEINQNIMEGRSSERRLAEHRAAQIKYLHTGRTR